MTSKHLDSGNVLPNSEAAVHELAEDPGGGTVTSRILDVHQAAVHRCARGRRSQGPQKPAARCLDICVKAAAQNLTAAL